MAINLDKLPSFEIQMAAPFVHVASPDCAATAAHEGEDDSTKMEKPCWEHERRRAVQIAAADVSSRPSAAEHDLSTVPQARMTLLGSNWGPQRKKSWARCSTTTLLDSAGHIHIVLELLTPELLEQMRLLGWEGTQTVPHGPAIMWQRNSFTVLSTGGTTLRTNTDRPGGEFHYATLQPIRPGV